MFAFLVLILFFAFSFLKPMMEELERRDALLLNATLSEKNTSQFVGEEWLRKALNVNSMNDDVEVTTSTTTAVKPDWSIVLGTFHHTHDENFNEFLISAGLSYFTRTIILSSSPTVTFDRIFEDEDDYYDPNYYHYTDTRFEDSGEGIEDNRRFQMAMITSFLVTMTQRFRLGETFTKQDYDGTPSKNKMVFVAPTVLHHFKEKPHVNTSIYHFFSREGLVTTIISEKTGMQAKRHFRRE